MHPRENAYLRHQQQRFMRPDSARFLRQDAERYLAPERKWDGQPRIEDGEEGAGRFTYGLRDGGTSYDGDRLRVYMISNSGGQPSGGPLVHLIRTTSAGDDGSGDGNGDGGQNSGPGDDLDNFLLAAAVSPGIGHNQGPPLEDPPQIPETKPSDAPSRFLRSAARWIGRAIGLGVATDAYMGLLNEVEWIKEKAAEIETYRDPPQTLQQLQDAVSAPRAGTEKHHIAEQTALERLGFSRREINSPENLVRIPTFKHYDISAWYSQPNKRFGGLSPREYLADKDYEERRRVGLEALVLFGVLKP